jgi:hypothetical protein
MHLLANTAEHVILNQRLAVLGSLRASAPLVRGLAAISIRRPYADAARLERAPTAALHFRIAPSPDFRIPAAAPIAKSKKS